jgi:uncharacterized protein
MTRLQLLPDLSRMAAEQWDALHDGSNPFVAHAFLAGLERTGCLRPQWGWTPRHAALFDGATLIAAAPGYLKQNSHGEFVFDFAWANAYAQLGRDYYPKWLLGVPYSPVPGPRLLARDDASRRALGAALPAAARELGVSSVHLNFLPEAETSVLPTAWLARHDVQFHWHDRGWDTFERFLDAMTHKRRKAIRQERARVQAAGYRFRCVHGEEASAADLDAMHDFYCLTFAEKGNSPALTREFFAHLARSMPRDLVLIFADRDDPAGKPRTVAGALFLRGGETLYGRYWGSEETAPGLHFETCYYQGIEYCLRHGLRRFEPGAQGEHKLARGFLPVLTHSRHLLLEPRFAQALAPWCAQERIAVARYCDLLSSHSPFRDEPAPAAPGS